MSEDPTRTCAACSQEISATAETCPACGQRQEEVAAIPPTTFELADDDLLAEPPPPDPAPAAPPPEDERPLADDIPVEEVPEPAPRFESTVRMSLSEQGSAWVEERQEATGETPDAEAAEAAEPDAVDAPKGKGCLPLLVAVALLVPSVVWLLALPR